MTTATATKPMSIPQRDEIDSQYTWNLADLYAGDTEWEKDFGVAEGLIKKAASFVGRLSESAGLLWECFEIRSELFKKSSRLYQYAHLSRDLDNRVSQYQAMTDRAAQLGAAAAAAFSFVEPELLKIDQKQLLELSGQFPKADVYDFYIKDLIRQRSHVRSQEVEELLAASAMIARGPESIFTMLDDADLTYPSITDENGNKVPLTKQRFAKFMESSDPRVRREASDGFYSSYKEHLNTTSASLSASVNNDVFYSRARRFDSSLQAALDSDNIPLSVYHSLIEATESDLSLLHKWIALRKKILKLDQIHAYDMHCPLFPDKDYEVAYDDAVSEILKAVQPLGSQYCDELAQAFKARWVDVYETKGKGSGAYSYGTFTCHPFVLMNYNDTVNNMFTLAHEMGHALHSTLANRTQPFPKAQYSIFIAEIASTLNEGLLLNHLLDKADDKLTRLYLLNREIDNTVGTFFHQVWYARFELEIHKEVEQGGALSPETMTELWADLTKAYYGPAMTIDEYSKLKWSRIPHFYNGFYVYQYATSYAASQAILDQIASGRPGTIDDYLGLLSSGGSDYPIELLKRCGVDMTTGNPVKATLQRFGKLVDQVEQLT
ncbi:MAG: oligoendopeptidase F [Candidatus Zixiibacteriota bacterium]